MSSTFTNMNNMISGGITSVNICTTEFSSDLKNLGSLINLATLSELGTPINLVKQLASLGGITPDIVLNFSNAGVSLDTVVNLTNPNVNPTNADQKAMYNAMANITGTTLTQVLQVFGVTTTNINTMADLLNPYKIFPNSFQTLSVTDINKVSQKIYVNSNGSVNGTLEAGLPTVATSTLS